MFSNDIVVGIDDSPASRAGLRWAAADALRGKKALRVLHVYDWRTPGTRMAVGGEYAEAMREIAQSVVDAAVEEAHAVAPEVAVTGAAVLGQPGDVLVAASRGAAGVVVGNRGHGGFASTMLGSVSQQVAMHASCPVTVVRGHTDTDGGSVVVGVDGSAGADVALSVAFEEAIRLGCGVTAVRAYRGDHPYGKGMAPMPIEHADERRASELRHLEADLAVWRQKYPDVDVECLAVDGHAAEVLVKASSAAQVVVVGTRGHGGFTGLLLGSVGLRLLHHSECPVIIARTGEDLRTTKEATA
jgi:nucleotide-binding universal stress UspA family protein